MAKRIIEGRWDCKWCDTKGILGRYRECPNCGKPRGEDVKFYLPSESEKMYVPEEEAKKINKNPDWLCNFCGSYNSDSLSKCKSCGAERGSKNYFDVQKEQQEKKQAKVNQVEDEKAKTESIERERDIEAKEKCGNILKIALASIGSIALLSLIVFILFTVLSPKNASMKITDFSWERTINVEQLKTFHESDWNLPDNARLTKQEREIHHYEQKLDHYETKSRQVSKTRISHYETHYRTRDLGNGYFEEESYKTPVYETYYETEYYEAPVYIDEPVYKTKYYYDIDRWVYERSLTTKGEDRKPYWSKASLLSDERISDKEERYRVTGVTDEKKPKTRTIEVNLETWKKFEIGQTIQIKIHVTGYVELIE